MKKKYRVVTNGEKFRIQYSYFGFFWTVLTTPNEGGGGSYEEFTCKGHAYNALLNIAIADERKRKGWATVQYNEADKQKAMEDGW